MFLIAFSSTASQSIELLALSTRRSLCSVANGRLNVLVQLEFPIPQTRLLPSSPQDASATLLAAVRVRNSFHRLESPASLHKVMI